MKKTPMKIIVCGLCYKTVDRLNKRIGCVPVYWLTKDNSFHDSIKNKYPGVITQVIPNAVKGIPGFNINYNTVDGNTLLKYCRYESIAISMMDRMDPEDEFSYGDRKRHYYNILSYWLKVVDSLKVDAVLFNEIPHVVYDYILYAVCREKGIKTVMFSPLALFGVIIPMNDFLCGNEKIREIYQSTIKENKKVLLDSRFAESLLKMQKDYNIAKPDYMRDVDSKEPSLFNNGKLIKIFNIHKYFYYIIHTVRFLYRRLYFHINGFFDFSLRGACYLHKRNFLVKDGGLTEREYYFYKRRSYKKKKEMHSFYANISITPSYEESYIFMALHYQPEATTSPFSGLYSDQLYVIKMLSESLPENWVLYVKENKSQLSPNNQHGERSRNMRFYQEVNNLQNVFFVPMNEDQFKLIDNSKAVVSINGSVGWEAAVRRRPSIVFSPSWYSEFDTVFHVSTSKDLQLSLSKIKLNSFVASDFDKVSNYLYAVQESSFSGYVHQSSKDASGVSSNKNINNFVDAIVEYIEY
jgi:hypothetical protein